MKLLVWVLVLAGAAMGAKKKDPATATPLDRYVSEAEARSAVAASVTPGSIWLPGSRLADGARDVRASQVDDLLTIVVAEQASAVSTGWQAMKISRSKSSSVVLGAESTLKAAIENPVERFSGLADRIRETLDS